MNIWEESLKKEEWYINKEKELSNKLDEINKFKTELVSFDDYLKLIKEKSDSNENIYIEYEDILRKMVSYFNEIIKHCEEIIKYYNKFYNEIPTFQYEYLDKDIDYLRDIISENNTYNNRTKDLLRKITNEKDSVFDLDFKIDKINGNNINNNLIHINEDDSMIITNKYEGITFDTIIDNTNNDVLKKWYEYLKELYYNPYRNFFLNENTVCNFKLVFRNPKTGLYTDKEPIVQISHSTSSKKTPVFGIGYNTYKAYSIGVKLLAGTMVTNNFDNIPLPHLHSISYANHISAEDLPPLDLYIIPIKHINPEGKFEIVMIKGIQFIDMKENDNAASTGLYYAFQYFAEDITVLDYEDVSDFYKVTDSSDVNVNYEIKEK